MDKAIAWYDSHAETLAPRYDGIAAEKVHGWLLDLLPPPGGLVLDIGAGSGRDAAWLASRGYDVLAAEPSEKLRSVAERNHPQHGIRWFSDRLPELSASVGTGLSFDMILLSAVWMHVSPRDRRRAFRKTLSLLRPGGLLAMTLRDGPVEPDRGMHEVSLAEIERLARDHGAFVERTVIDGDRLGRDEVKWIQIAIRLPDDGTGALPALRHVILNDDKASTYKLGLLRVLCRIANVAAGVAREADEDTVSVPMGLVALYWIRFYLPLLSNDLPQMTRNRRFDGLGFVKDPLRLLSDRSAKDLDIGYRFEGDTAKWLHQALKDAAKTITDMPANYVTFADGGVMFPVERGPRMPVPSVVVLEPSYFYTFGEMRVPKHMWNALRRFGVWIEPSIVSEWKRLMEVYAASQERELSAEIVAGAMEWADPERTTAIPRSRAKSLLEAGPLYCVWSGKKLTERVLDIDHCLPWSAWPCGDLWNLVPSHRAVNQNQKRERLPSEKALIGAKEPMFDWWGKAYGPASDPILAERFLLEAAVSLPGVKVGLATESEVFDGLTLQRLRLKHDQQVPEWDGVSTVRR